MRGPPASPVEEAPEEELAGARVQPIEPATGDAQRHDSRPFGDHFRDAEPMTKSLGERRDHAKGEQEAERDEVERAPVIGGDVVEDELVPGRNLMEPRERDPRVRGEVYPVPHLVAQPPPDDHDGCDDDGDQQPGPDRRGDHSRVDPAAEHRRDLLRQRHLVHQCVAPDGEDDVREDEVDAGMTVPAVPDAQPVEADEALEPGQPREQQDLEQRRVRGEEARDPGQRGEQLAGREIVRDVRRRVAAYDCP